ncbi:hypothetical protein P2318_11340 [Myxococcaceae bacterium GXIMD 01537]
MRDTLYADVRFRSNERVSHEGPGVPRVGNPFLTLDNRQYIVPGGGGLGAMMNNAFV